MTHPDLPYEQAKNAEYLEKLEKKLMPNPRIAVDRNPIWIDGAAHQQNVVNELHPLIGRIGLDSEDEDLGRSFYIGPRRFDQDGIRVISWAAPRAADVFFQPDPKASEIAARVVVRRTFSHRAGKISGLDDEIVRQTSISPFTEAEISVPAPFSDTSPRRPITPAGVPPAELGHKVLPRGHPEGSVAPQPQGLHSPHAEKRPRSAGIPDDVLRRGMRAPEVVLERLSAPRSGQLASVLPTLQPDQHRLVSWPHDEPLIVQGHPGTGKTIVAAYRAAYLVNPAHYEGDGLLAGQPIFRVLLIGPTGAYVRHVSELIKLPMHQGARVHLTHLERLLGRTTLVKGQWGGRWGGRYSDVDAKARGLAERAASIARAKSLLKAGSSSARANIRTIYKLIKSNGSPEKRLSSDNAQISWMTALPDFDSAFWLRRYLPLMAQCRLAYEPIPESDKYHHIIVDEAQDVSPIEWNVLDQHLARNGQWTLLGDMNQRRSDTTYGSWQEIADHLGIGDEDPDLSVQKLRRGYRSTDAILRFADQLLPASQRGSRSIQTVGTRVLTARVRTAGQLLPTVVELADRYSAKYEAGTTAVITMDLGAVRQELGTVGWRRTGPEAIVWSKAGRKILLYDPENARGLEFDAVVVVEPAAFPENVGRKGQLYTSLTRANRELAVVWHGELPDKLRKLVRGREQMARFR